MVLKSSWGQGTLPLLGYRAVPGADEDELTEKLCAVWDSWEAAGQKGWPPAACPGLWLLFFTHRRQEYIIISNILDQIDRPLFSTWCVSFQVMFYVHMAMYRFWLGAGVERERHLLWCTSVLLNFEPYEWLKYKNKYKGYALGRRKVVPDGGLDFRKERRGIEGEIRVNTNESWLHKTMKLMFKIYRELKFTTQ